MMIIKSKNTL